MENDYFRYPDNFENELKRRFKQGFKIIRLYPKTHKYPIDTMCFKKFYEVLNHCNFPIMISLNELDITANKYIEWEKILKIAGTYENIPVIIDGDNSKEIMYSNYFFTLVNNSSNIYLNTHRLMALNQIEDLATTAGSGRLIFDTYFPYYDTHLSVYRLLSSNLDEFDVKKIAKLNILKIFENINI